MKFRQTNTAPLSAAKSGFSSSSGYRVDKDRRLPSQRKAPRKRRRPDPLAGVWESEIVPILKSAPGLRPVAIFEEIVRRHPEIGVGVRRTLERRIRPRSTLIDTLREAAQRRNPKMRRSSDGWQAHSL